MNIATIRHLPTAMLDGYSSTHSTGLLVLINILALRMWAWPNFNLGNFTSRIRVISQNEGLSPSCIALSFDGLAQSRYTVCFCFLFVWFFLPTLLKLITSFTVLSRTEW
jgi:hypothetical protein